MADFKQSLLAPILLSASITSALSDELSSGYIIHDYIDTMPKPEVRFNEIEGVKFVLPFGNMDLPPKDERITIIPSEMNAVGRLIGIEENGEKKYLCALTAITPPEPFKVTGNGNDIAVTAGHCIPGNGIESGAGDYVSYEGLFVGSNGQQTVLPIAEIHHHQTNQAINLAHLPEEIKDTLPALRYLTATTFHSKLFDTALVQFAEPLPDTIDKIEVEFNVLDSLTQDSSVNYFGYPRNTRGLTADPSSTIGDVKGTVFATDAYTNVGSSGGIFIHDGKAVGVLHGGFGFGEAGEWTSAIFDNALTDSFNSVSPRIDYAGPYVNAPFLEIENSGSEFVSVRAGTETNLLPSADTIVPGKKPIIEDENRKYQVLDRQNGFLGILIEDPETRVFEEENLFYVPEDSIIQQRRFSDHNLTETEIISTPLSPLPLKP